MPLDASGRILYGPDRPRRIPLASPRMDDDDEPRRLQLSNREYRYVQVADDLAARIRAREWAFDATLPRREDIAREYGVGVMTVRAALKLLAARGMVRPMPSVGTVVIWAGHEQGTT